MPKPRRPKSKPPSLVSQPLPGVEQEPSSQEGFSSPPPLVNRVLRDIVAPGLIDLAPQEDLRGLLKPHEGYLASRGIFLDGIEMDYKWKSRLYETLVQFDPDLPAELQQGLIDIADIVNERAHDLSVDLARLRQIKLPFDSVALDTPVDIIAYVFRLYLNDRKLFNDTVARQQATRMERFSEFYPRNHRPLLLNETQKELFRSHFSTYFSRRNRTPFCDLQVIEVEQEVQFHIIHGRPPRSQSTVKNGKERWLLSFVPDKRDLLIFDRASGRLAVSASHPSEQERYREHFGRIFFGAPGHFLDNMDITAAPLCMRRQAALSTAGIPGLKRVRLRELRVRVRDRRSLLITCQDNDLGELLDEEQMGELLDSGEVVSMRFDFLLEGQKRMPKVLLMPPNKLIYDRRMGAFQAREFLIRQGFVVLPQIEREPTLLLH